MGRIIKQKIKLLLKTIWERQIIWEDYSMSKFKKNNLKDKFLLDFGKGWQVQEFSNLLNKYVLNSYKVSGTVLGAEIQKSKINLFSVHTEFTDM